MSEFVMPALGAAMVSGTLIEWHRKAGEHVRRGEVIADVETDKGTIEVEVFTTGLIEKLLVEPGTQVPVGTPLAIIREEGREEGREEKGEEKREAGPPPPSPVAPLAPASIPTPPAPVPQAVSSAAAPPSPPRASPLARRRARELGVDLTRVTGTGPHGAITVEDVEKTAARAAPPSAAAPAPAAVPPAADLQARMRRAIAAAMSLANREIPHFYLATTIDLGPALAWLARENEKRPVAERIIPGVLFLRAVARAAREVPELNAHWTGEAAPPLPNVHVGFAIALRGGGLVAPAILDADQKDLGALMTALRDLVERARSGHLKSSEMSGGTITVTSLGERGAEEVFPVIFPPQVAMVGVGRIVERPWVVGGQLAVREVVRVTLAVDHRVSDGHRASRFMSAIEARLLHPEAS
jgi:pyruvate dehydrogenase E2 component (dihydrolipoamide acetyltransferase)